MSKGWISVHRQLQDHWLWKDKPFSRGQAWLDILLLVNHEDNKTLLGNELIEVKRGERITSEYILGERWGWSRTKVRNFLELLEKENMIKNIKEGKKRTRLRVCNYNDYQLSKNYERTTEELDENYEGTTEELGENLNNNDNNYNNDNNENNLLLLSISKEFPNFYQWINEKNYTYNLEEENLYYLQYLYEKLVFTTKEKGKDHEDTKNARNTLEDRKKKSTKEEVEKVEELIKRGI